LATYVSVRKMYHFVELNLIDKNILHLSEASNSRRVWKVRNVALINTRPSRRTDDAVNIYLYLLVSATTYRYINSDLHSPSLTLRS